MHQIGYGADDVIKTHTTGANEFTSCSHEIHRVIRRQHKGLTVTPPLPVPNCTSGDFFLVNKWLGKKKKMKYFHNKIKINQL